MVIANEFMLQWEVVVIMSTQQALKRYYLLGANYLPDTRLSTCEFSHLITHNTQWGRL